MRGAKFSLDKENGKWMGVCAGVAKMTGWDVTLVRVGLVVVTIAGGFPWTIIAYVATGTLAKPKAERFGGSDYQPARVRTSAAELKGSMRDIDRRLAEVETYVTTGNSTLAREIEALR